MPDLNLPFLGVHVTPSPDGTVSLGPTAIPAWGRENYRGFDGVEPMMAMNSWVIWPVSGGVILVVFDATRVSRLSTA